MEDSNQLLDYGRVHPPRSKRKNRPNRPFERVEVDLEKELKNLLRDLSQQERYVLKVFEHYYEKHGKLIPRKSLKAINGVAKDLGLDTTFTQEDIDDYLFVDLFPYNVDIPFRTAIKRLMGFDGTVHEPSESLATIKFASDLLSIAQNSQIPVIPTTGHIDQLSKSGIFIPGLVRKAPLPSRILGNFPGESWKDIVSRTISATPEVLSSALKLRVTFEDCVNGYKSAFDYFFPNGSGKEGKLVTVEMLKEYDRIHDTKIASRIGRLIAAKRRIPEFQYFTLDDIRRAADCPTSSSLSKMELRKGNAVGRGKEIEEWDRVHVAASYRILWLKKQELEGMDCDPPMPRDINSAVKKQTRILNEYGTLTSEEARSAARDQGVPTVLIPTVPTINKVFGGMPELLGFVEKSIDEPLIIRNSASLRGVARGARQRNVPNSQLPQCVIDRLAI